MIDRDHAMPITCQASLPGMTRGSVYYLPRRTSAADLELMRLIDELHLEYPFMGAHAAPPTPSPRSGRGLAATSTR